MGKEEEKKKKKKKQPKKEEDVSLEKKDEAPPPEEVVMRVYMHCQGCARKVSRCLKGSEGVEEVKTDCKKHNVVVKGQKAAEDPMKLVDRIQKKTRRKVELLTPLPPPPMPEPEKQEVNDNIMTVVLKVHMHCHACADEIKKRILKMKGVQSAEAELKGSQVTVKGVFEASKLVEYVYKRTGRHAAVVKQEPEKPKAEKKKEKGKAKAKEEKEAAAPPEEKEKEKAEKFKEEEEVEKREGGAPPEEAAQLAGDDGEGKAEVTASEFQYSYYYPRYEPQYNPYPPQIFSDENPNACAVM